MYIFQSLSLEALKDFAMIFVFSCQCHAMVSDRMESVSGVRFANNVLLDGKFALL